MIGQAGGAALEAVALTPGSAALADGLAAAVAAVAAEGGVLAALDLTGPPPAEPWSLWVTEPSAALLTLLDADARAGRAPRTLVIVKVGRAGSDPLAAIRAAAVEAIRGIVGCAVLDLAASGMRANVVVADEQTSRTDLLAVTRHLLDPAASGFSDGVTLRLSDRIASGERAAPDGSRRAVVTGAASGMGLAAARRFRAAGYDVVMTDINAQDLHRAAEEIGALPVVGDVVRSEELLAALSAPLHDGLDALVIAHGVDIGASFGELDRSRFVRGFDIDATAVYRLAWGLRPYLTRRAPANIAIIASAQGLVSECCGVAGYTAAKHAVVGFGKAIAEPLRAEGIAINLLCPGWVDTPFHSDDVEGAKAGGAATPVGRMGTAEEMAEALLLLSQIDATGVVYAPTGGLAPL